MKHFLPLLLLATPALAQADSRLDQIEKRVAEMEARHQAELKARDEKIQRLETDLQSRTPGPTAADIDRTVRAVFADADAHSHDHHPKFTPQIAVIPDFVGTVSNNRSNDALNRFDIREVEIDFVAKLDKRADGVVILTAERDVENPVFLGDEPAEGPETSFNIEEAYVFLHDFGVKDLSAKIGRFNLRFGRQNMLHPHERLTTDPPLVNQAFLAPEALADAGVSLSYVLPHRFTFDQHIEATLEIISGEGGASESASLPGDLTVDSPAVNTHVLWSIGDFNYDDYNLELGTSWLWGKRDSANDLEVNLFGLDATLTLEKYIFQAELMYANLDTETGTEHAWGAYVLGQRELRKNLHAGIRLDWTQNPTDDDQEAWAVTPYVTWHYSSALRFRLMYQHKGGDRPDEDTIWFQVTWTLGSHPKHAGHDHAHD